MGGARVGVLLGSVFVFAACASPPRNDLADNDKLYRWTGYRAKLSADRRVCVLPIVDERKPPVVDATSPYPVTFVSEGHWHRAVPEMIDELVRREVEDSGVFGEVVDEPRPDVCLLRVSIVSFEGGIQEVTTGRRTFATTRLLAIVEGPEQDGQRPELLREELGQQMQSEVVMTPPSPLLLLGRCTRLDMHTLLSKIDQGNLGRSAVATPGR